MLGLLTNSGATETELVAPATETGVDAANGVGLVVTCIVGVRGSGGGGGASGMTPAGTGGLNSLNMYFRCRCFSF